jgi:hypothetical protein
VWQWTKSRRLSFILHSPTFFTFSFDRDLGEVRVFQLIKLAVFALSIFAVVTANDDQKDAMWKGAQAFGGALVTACTRQDGPCLSLAKMAAANIAVAWVSPDDERPEAATTRAVPHRSRQQADVWLSPDDGRPEAAENRAVPHRSRPEQDQARPREW